MIRCCVPEALPATRSVMLLPFFGISETELHNTVSFRHLGETVSAETAAARIRNMANREAEHNPMRALRVFVGERKRRDSLANLLS